MNHFELYILQVYVGNWIERGEFSKDKIQNRFSSLFTNTRESNTFRWFIAL